MEYEYIVVGSGISGLNTAYKLCNGKNNILVIERNNRIGGRLNTYEDNKKKILYEVGGARFHKGHKLLFELIKTFDLEKEIFPITNDKTFIPINHKFKKKYNTNNILKNVLKKSESLKKEELLKLNLNEVCEKFLTKEECIYLKSSFEYLAELENLNAYESIESFKNDLNYDLQFYLFKNGFMDLLKKIKDFLKEQKCEIKLQHTLIDINKNKDTFELNVLNNDKTKKYNTKNLILALDKTPLLSFKYLSKIKSILDSVDKVPLLRIYAIYPKDPKTKKVWFHDIGKVTTDLEIKFIIPYNPNLGLIMISYTDQKHAEYWNNIINKGNKKLEEELNKQLKKIFPKKKIPKTTFLKFHYWHNGIHTWRKNNEADKISKEILQPFKDEKLFICGSAYSERQGWVEGALETSEEVLKLINNIKTNKKTHHVNPITKNNYVKQDGGGKEKTKKKSKKQKSKKSNKSKKSKKLKKYTRKEVSKHNKQNDLWVIINKNVLDVTKWQHSHPGSPGPLQHFGGKDATNAFNGRGHSDYAKKLMKKYIIGKV